MKSIALCFLACLFAGAASGQPSSTPSTPSTPTSPASPSGKSSQPGTPAATPPAPALTPQQQAEVDAWAKAATPGPMHAWLARGAGVWNASVKMLFPGQPPAESTGTMVVEMMLGGRYQSGLFSGTMMGKPFQGVGITGYNNITRKFESTWMDTFTTGTMFSTGTLQDDKLVMLGEMQDPATGKPVKQKQIFSYSGENTMTAEFFNIVDGKEMPIMTITYTRAAAPADSKPSESKPGDIKPSEGKTGGTQVAPPSGK